MTHSHNDDNLKHWRVQGKNRRPTRRHPEKGNPPPIPRPGNQRTPRTRPHHHNHPPTLLVAKHERMDRTIRKRMRQMPTKQEPHETSKSTPLPHPHTDRRTPIPDRSNGPDHPTPNQQRIRRHPHDSRPRMHESSRIPPLQNNDHRTRSSQTILRQRLPMVWPTQQGHIRQRPPIHILLREGTRPTTRDQTKRVLSVPPPNRRTIRTDKSMGGTIPPPDHQQRPNRLERLARDSHHGAQQSQKRHHQHRPLGSTPRLHASPTPHGPPSIA